MGDDKWIQHNHHRMIVKRVEDLSSGNGWGNIDGAADRTATIEI